MSLGDTLRISDKLSQLEVLQTEDLNLLTPMSRSEQVRKSDYNHGETSKNNILQCDVVRKRIHLPSSPYSTPTWKLS